jgi:hypothetical protein
VTNQSRPEDLPVRFEQLVTEIAPLSDRQREDLAALHRELTQRGELPASRRYRIEERWYPDLSGDYCKRSLHWHDPEYREGTEWPVDTGNDLRLAMAMARHGAGRDLSGYDSVVGFVGTMGSLAGLSVDREYTVAEVVTAAETGEAAYERRQADIRAQIDAQRKEAER